MNALADDTASRLAELAEALDALGVDVRVSNGVLVVHGPRRSEVRGRSMMVVDADDGAIAIGLPWAERRYRVPGVDALRGVVTEWFVEGTGTPNAIGADVCAAHRLTEIGPRVAPPFVGPRPRDVEEPSSLSTVDHRVHGDRVAAHAILDVVADGHLLLPRLLVPDARAWLDAQETVPHVIRVTPFSLSFHAKPDRPWRAPPLSSADACFGEGATRTMVFRLSEGMTITGTRRVRIASERAEPASEDGPVIVVTERHGSFAFALDEVEFMAETTRDLSFDPLDGTLTIRGAYPRLTDLGRKRVRENNHAPRCARREIVW